MIKTTKGIIKKFLYRNTYSSDAFVKHLRKTGCKVGDYTYFFSPGTVCIDPGRRSLIEIGKYCCVTRGVQILCHDYSWTVLRRTHHEILPDAGKKVIVGDNVFLGWNCIIMGGVTIGDNVIVGAHSVVTHDIESNMVVAGNPAKKICTIEEYYQKKKNENLNDATNFLINYYNTNRKIPSDRDMGWFSIYYLKRDLSSERFLRSLPFKGDCMDEVIYDFYKSDPLFDSVDEFFNYAISLKSN